MTGPALYDASGNLVQAATEKCTYALGNAALCAAGSNLCVNPVYS